MKLRNNEIGLLFSIFLHVLLVVLFLVQMPDFFTTKNEAPQRVIKFDIVSVREFNNLLPKKSELHNLKMQVKNSTASTQKTTDKKTIARPKEVNKTPPKNKTDLTKKEQIKPKDKIPKDKKLTKNKKPKQLATDDKAQKTKQPKKVKKSKPRPKKVAKKSVDPMEALLKDLEASADSDKSDNRTLSEVSSSPYSGKAFANGMPSQFYDEFSPLSISEKSLIRSQLEKHWNLPQGIDHIQKSIVSFKIKLDPNGIIKDAKIVGKHCPGMTNAECEKLVNSIIRAIKKASPLKGLKPSRHENWADIQVNFAPSF